jgi:two-component system, chemotaxis family, chemotaxis protein CheY
MTKHVLLVEDHHDLQMILRTRLELAGFRVTLAQDGLEALAVLEEVIPDIILLDLSLPLMDGYAFLEAWEKRKPSISPPIIVISADQQAATKLAQKTAAIFTKPFSFELLHAAIREQCKPL